MIIKNIPPTGNKCVYVHRRKSDGIVFYIGIGSKARSRNRWNRSVHWKNVVAKHDYEIDYLAQNVSVEEAKEIEIEAIKYYREKVGDKLTNITDGGDGGYGLTGEKNPKFVGHWLFYNLDEKVYWLCSGTMQLENDGFKQGAVSEVKSIKTTYLTSTRLHKDGVKIRFQVHQSADIDELVNFIDEHELNEAELSDVEIRGQNGENSNNFGQLGESCPNFKGHYVGTSTDKIIILSGNKMMKELGFNPSNLGECVSGRRKTSKGFSWTKTLDLEQFKSTPLTPANDYTSQLLQA